MHGPHRQRLSAGRAADRAGALTVFTSAPHFFARRGLQPELLHDGMLVSGRVRRTSDFDKAGMPSTLAENTMNLKSSPGAESIDPTVGDASSGDRQTSGCEAAN